MAAYYYECPGCHRKYEFRKRVTLIRRYCSYCGTEITAEEIDRQEDPMQPRDIRVFFVPRRVRPGPGESITYSPAILGVAQLFYTYTEYDPFEEENEIVAHEETLALLQPVGKSVPAEPWVGSTPFDFYDIVPDSAPKAGTSFVPLPPELVQPKFYAGLARSLEDYLDRERRMLDLWYYHEAAEPSRPMEAEQKYRLRVASEINRINEELKREEREEYGLEYGQAQGDGPLFTLGKMILGALFGYKPTGLEDDRQRGLGRVTPETLALERVPIEDISVEYVALAWMPWKVLADGRSEPAYRFENEVDPIV